MRLRLLALAGLFSAVFLLCCTVLLVTIVPAHAYNPAYFPVGSVQANGDSTIEFSAPLYSVTESGGFAVITATRTGNPASPATVTVYRTGGTATKDADFELATAGSRDKTFGTSNNFTSITNTASPVVAGSIVLSDGKIVVAGYFNSYEGVPLGNIARFHPNGQLDTSFQSASDSLITSLYQQPDGKIIASGLFTTYNGIRHNRIVRINEDGTLDSSFNVGTGADAMVYKVIGQQDGKILVGGGFSTFNGVPRSGIVRLLSTGAVDLSFDPGSGIGNRNQNAPAVLDYIGDIALYSNNQLLVSGYFSRYNSIPRLGVVRINENGSLDEGFSGSSATLDQGFAIEVLDDGKILYSSQLGTFRLNLNGSKDLSFNAYAGYQQDLLVLPDGKIIAAGVNNNSPSNFTRLNPDGTIDNSFKIDLDPRCGLINLNLLPNGKLLVGSWKNFYTARNCYPIARYHGDLNFNWAAGEGGSKTITVPITTDNVLEGSETLQLALTNTVGATLGGQVTATLTILDDETLPSLSISDTSVLEGNSGAANAVFTVTLNTTSPLTTSVSYSTVNGTAMGGDYIPQSGVITFSPGITHQLITVTVNGDRQIEPDETFSVLLSNSVNATLAKDTGVATILADDATVQWSSSIYTYNESAGLITLKANRVGATSGVVTAQIVITNVTTSVADYNLPPSNVLTWGDGESGEKSLGIFLINDTLVESTESAQLGLIASDNATVGSPAVVTLFIEDNDVPPCEPLLVTKSNDDGAGTLCGTLSFALSQPVTTSNAYTITFALTDTRTITFSGALTGAVKAGVTLDGGTDPEPIVLNGNGVAGDGLQLTGGNALRNLRVRNFDGRQIVTNGTGNRFERVRAERNGS
jgi:uncharacterized delta-60 repeat protein